MRAVKLITTSYMNAEYPSIVASNLFKQIDQVLTYGQTRTASQVDELNDLVIEADYYTYADEIRLQGVYVYRDSPEEDGNYFQDLAEKVEDELLERVELVSALGV